MLLNIKADTCLVIISRAEHDLHIKRRVNFSASGHGKGEVDSAAGFLKTEAKRAIISNLELHIANAKDLYQFAQENLAERNIPTVRLHKRRFFYVGEDEVPRDTSMRSLYKTVSKTRQIHCIRSLGKDGKIANRELSCYCISCINEEFDQCENKDYVMPYEEVSFGNFNVEEPMDTTEDEEEDPEPVYTDYSGMIAKDSVIAIKPSSDSFLMYFLFYVNSDGVEVLDQDITNLGHAYPKGTEVFRGYYYNNTKLSREGLIFKKDITTEVLVPKESVLYVGIELKESRKPGEFVLSHIDHDDIICYVSGS